MAWNREDRVSPEGEDNRHAFQRDRDRILYSTAFRRLAETTQVAPHGETQVFHNRLTHTLEVAQIGRRIAEVLLAAHAELEEYLSPDVVEAACLAHDLGHPPFGHLGEKALNRYVLGAGERDGYEGNAQSFRIVTRLAQRSMEFPGLNLTRATLNAILKYPWMKAESGKESRKFGAFDAEAEFFDWARQGTPTGKTLEAEIMDYADEVAYSVHDLYDFFRAGFIPLHELKKDSIAWGAYLARVKDTYDKAGLKPTDAELGAETDIILKYFFNESKFKGSTLERASLRAFCSYLIRFFVCDAWDIVWSGRVPVLRIKREAQIRLLILKNLTVHYVIESRELTAIQAGHGRIIANVYNAMLRDLNGVGGLTPKWALELLEDGQAIPRVAADIVASLTEAQATELHKRLIGVSSGSVMMPAP